MADGSIYLWDVRGTQKKRGSILDKSPQGSVSCGSKRRGPNGDLLTSGVVEGIAVDSDRDLAFVASESRMLPRPFLVLGDIHY